MTRVYLSPPDVGPAERQRLLAAFDSNWIAPLGPEVDAFEAEVAARAGVDHAAALSSGTAALHLALLLVGVGPGQDVLVPSFTFVATAAAVTYVGARPVLVDSAADHWTVDPDLVDADLARRARAGELPGAVVAVDLYGETADYGALEETCHRYDVPLVSDAAEALGASRDGRPAGSFGRCAVFSFNGNKIITTSGGGMLVSDDGDLVARARHLATQARDPAPHYQHSEIGFNYRLSNLLAAVGRAQLAGLDQRMARRRAVHDRYVAALGDVPGIAFMPHDPRCTPNWWLTCVTIDPEIFGADREAVRTALEAQDIEARPTWKPLHLQPVFAGAPQLGGDRCAAVFDRGLCLPTGSALSAADQNRVVEVLRSVAR